MSDREWMSFFFGCFIGSVCPWYGFFLATTRLDKAKHPALSRRS